MLTIIQTTVLKYWIAARYFFNDFSPLFKIFFFFFFFFFFLIFFFFFFLLLLPS